MYQIGIDIGGTNIKIGLVNDRLQLAATASVPFPHTAAQGVADLLADAIRSFIREQQVSLTEVESVGIVIPGSLDATGTVVLNAYNLGFHNVPFCQMMQKQFPDVPVLMANDADGAALAELYAGAFRGCKTAVLITLGTGVGGGIIMGGKMFTGGMRHGVELGHTILLDGGVPCSCGNRGCTESYCAASALARFGAEAMQKHPESLLYARSGGDASKIDAKLVTDCAKAADPTATAVFREFLEHLAAVCSSVFNFLDPEVIAIGGGLCAAGAFLFDPLQTLVDERCFYSERGRLVPAELGNDAGMIGAAMLHRDRTAD